MKIDLNELDTGRLDSSAGAREYSTGEIDAYWICIAYITGKKEGADSLVDLLESIALGKILLTLGGAIRAADMLLAEWGKKRYR